MKYIAIQVSEKPFIIWSSIPEGSFENPESEYYQNPLVLSEEDIPEVSFGVCPLKIVDGELVNITLSEMNAFKDQYNETEFLREQFQLIKQVNSGTFIYDSKSFPMDERSRLFYESIKNIVYSPDEAIALMTHDGKQYDLFEAGKRDFFSAYYEKLLELSKPNFKV